MSVLELTFPSDARYRDTVRALSIRVAEYVGFPTAEATNLGDAIDRAVEGVIEHASSGSAHHSIDLAFATDEGAFEARVSVGDTVGGRLERGLAAAAEPLASMRRAVDRIEFGRDRDVEFCRLVRRLPG
jgi:hypothetical protein